MAFFYNLQLHMDMSYVTFIEDTVLQHCAIIESLIIPKSFLNRTMQKRLLHPLMIDSDCLGIYATETEAKFCASNKKKRKNSKRTKFLI